LFKSNTTVRLTFLAHSVRMTLNFQGLPWFECGGVVNMIFAVLKIWRICGDFISVNRCFCYKFSLHTINLARINLSRNVFTAY